MYRPPLGKRVLRRVAINGNWGGPPLDLKIKVGRFRKKLAGLGKKLAGLVKKLAGWGKSWQVCEHCWQFGKNVGRLRKKL